MNRVFLLIISLALWGCTAEDSALPILGEKVVDPDSGELRHYQAPAFQLTNQYGQPVSEQSFVGKIQVVDFFFTSCPTICPTMTNHMKAVAESFTEEDRLALISCTIDPRNDTPERLRKYAEERELQYQNWFFLTGYRDHIFEIAKGYKVRAFDDSDAHNPNNLIHDGTFVLVDGDRHIRGYYNGLDRADMDRLIGDVEKLLRE